MLAKVLGTIAVVAIVAGVTPLTVYAADPLGRYNIDKNGISVSGISSGGYMAQQFHTAHSESLMGVGILAGGPYNCAESTRYPRLLNALNICTNALAIWPYMGPPNVQRAIKDTLNEAGKSTIDTPDNMGNDKVWLFSGTEDALVPRHVMDVVHAYYFEFVDKKNILYVTDVPAPHAMITDDYGNGCMTYRSPYINDCDYDAAGKLLQHIYLDLKAKVPFNPNQIKEFDQTEFFDPSDHSVSMNEAGYIYVPKSCDEGTRCRLHIAFHGCEQYSDMVGDAFYGNAGYNEWAEANNLIVLYPQTRKWTAFAWRTNPKGCWDWWGYSGENYHNKNGKQITAIKAMINRLLGEYVNDPVQVGNFGQ